VKGSGSALGRTAERGGEDAAPDPPAGAPPIFASRARDTADWVRARALGIAFAVSVAALLGYRLGASLVGARVFLGLDLLYRFEPWESSPHPAGFTTSSLYVSDHLDYFIPGIREAVTRLWHGDLAGWSSAVGGGSPLLTTPNFGLLSPGRWVYFVMPTSLAPGWAKLLEMAFAALFTYLLVRRLSGSKLAGGIAGFVYPMTGFMIAWTNWPQVAVGCVIPAVFWAIERYVQEQRLRAAVPVALACALLILGGFPAVAGQTLYFAGGYALVRLLSTFGRDVKALARHALSLGAALALGFGVAAFQLLPFATQFLEQVDLSYRDRGFFAGSPWHYLLSATFPASFGGNQLWVGASPMDINTYVGATVVLLAALGTMAALSGRLHRSAGGYFVFMVVAVLGLVYAQGGWSAWLDHLPVLHGNPIGRIRSQLGLPVAVLAAAGFDALYRGALDTGWTRYLRPGWNWITMAVAAAVAMLIGSAGWLMTSGRVVNISAPGRVQRDVLLAVVPVAVALLLMVLGMRSSRARPAALFVLAVSIVAEAFAATSFYWPTAGRSSMYPSDDAIVFLKQHLGDDRLATLGYAMRPNATQYYGLRTLNGHAFLPERMRDLIRATDPSAFQGGPTYTILNPAVSAVIDTPGLDRLGVKYLVGSIDSVVPGTASTPQLLPGVPDPLAHAEGTLPLQRGRWYSQKTRGGPIRGVDIPLSLAGRTAVTVALRDQAGRVFAQTTRHADAGTWTVPVPLAAEIAPSRSSAVTVSIRVDVDGVQARRGAGAALVLQAVRPPAVDNTARLAFAADGVVIWERLNYLPRIRWDGRATVIRDPAKRIAAVARAPAERDTVILSSPPRPALAAAGSDVSRLRVRSDRGDTVRVSADASQPGYVVVSDNIQQDFVATVDGHRADIVAADYAGGAVYVPGGRHEIVISYAPGAERSGAAISVGSAILLVLVGLPPALLVGLRRRLRLRRQD
jgi:hypothetical protein